MLSPELLRRYPFFGYLNPNQLEVLAMIGEETKLKDDQIVLEEGKPANALFFLLEGGIDLYHTVKAQTRQKESQEILVCQINVGEPFGISALIEPNVLRASGRSNGASRVLQFDGKALQAAMKADPGLELVLVREMAKAAFMRLDATRVLLAAAWL
jgi:CRP-like cAMP-binding protein